MTARRFVFGCLFLALATVAPAVATPLPPIPWPRCIDPRGCPDLIVDGARMAPFVRMETISATNCQVVEGMVVAGTRRIMRFTFTTPNQGIADVIIGRPQDRPDLFVFSPCHGHYHFREYADYRLWSAAQFADWDAARLAKPEAKAAQILAEHPELVPVTGGKRGFCMIDLRRYDALSIQKYTGCDFQGISAGWADEYYYGLDGQFVDVTGVPAGSYVLESEVNAEHFLGESDYTNNRAWVNVTVS